jgi:long-chain acyl-CoA synthetase
VKITTSIDENSPWFKSKYWPEKVPKQLTFDDSKTVYNVLKETSSEIPDYNVIWFLDTYVKYKELLDMVDRFASGLLNLGVKKGDVFALILPSCIQHVVAFYAAIKIGVIITGVNPTYKSGEVLFQLENTGTKHVLILDALYKTLFEPIRYQLDIKTVISTNVVDLASGMSRFKKSLGRKTGKIPKGDVPQSYDFIELLNSSPDSPKAEIDQENDPATYLMTGGTTGIPKAAVLTHRNIYVNALQVMEWIIGQPTEKFPEPGPGGCTAIIVPLFHSYGMLVMNTAIACRAWIMLFPKPPKTEDFLNTLDKLDIPNGLSYPGAEVLFQRIIELPNIEKYKDAVAKISSAFSAAGPLHKHVQEGFKSLTGIDVVDAYGLTEASPAVSGAITNYQGEYLTRGTIGVPYSGTEWRIFSADDFEAGPITAFGEEKGIGELCVHGPQVMKEYLNNPEQTAATIREWNGKKWLLTGDIGYMTDFGGVVITSRKKELIKMKGYSIYPTEVEELVAKHHDVLEVAIAGIPDQDPGPELVKAWVRIKEGSNLTSESLQTWCKENMTHYKVPKEIEIRKEIPKNMIGKVMRRVLQENDPKYQVIQKK